MGQKFSSVRRRGVALLAGTALFGAAAIIAGQGVAQAATPVATATEAAPTNILATGTNQPGALVTLNITGTPVAGDKIVITVACSGSTIQFSSATTSAGSVAVASSGTCGASVMDELVLSGLPTTLNPTITLTPSYTTAGASGSATLSGSYVPAVGTATPITFTPNGVNAVVSVFTITANSPAVTLNPSQANQGISPINIVEAAGGHQLSANGGFLCVAITGANTAGDTFVGTPSASNNGAGTITYVSGSGSATLRFAVTDAADGSANLTISNLAVTTGAGTGPATGVVSDCGAVNYANVTLFTAARAVTLNRIAGPIVDSTVAMEFTAAFPGGNRNAVLATDLDPYDALSASFLEGNLHTGVLITPENSFGPDAQAAMRNEGVTTVYVVGGPDAISAATIAQIKATPAYMFGGNTLTGSDLQVANGGNAIYGQTADDTAQKIATFAGTSVGAFPVVNGAYLGTNTSGGNGAYNDTAGNGSATGPVAVTPTAVVVQDGGYQDAVSVGGMAYKYQLPVLLTPGNPATTLGTQAQAALTSLGIKQVIVAGGQDAINNAVVTAIQALGISVVRIAGQDATDTAGQLANFELATNTGGLGLGWGANTTGFLAGNGDVDGSDPLAWGDLLAAAPLGGGANVATYGQNEPILQVQGTNTVGPYTTTILTEAGSATGIQGDTSISILTVLGGPLAVAPATATQMQVDLGS